MQGRVVERGVDPDALARAFALVKGGENRCRRAPSSDQIGHRRRRHVRRGRQQAGQRLVRQVVPGARRLWSVLAVAADRADDQAREPRAQRLGRQVEPRQGAGAEALQQDIGAVEQREQDVSPAAALEVERHALDSRQKELRERAAVLAERRRGAHRVAVHRFFDFDHSRAEVAQEA